LRTAGVVTAGFTGAFTTGLLFILTESAFGFTVTGGFVIGVLFTTGGFVRGFVLVAGGGLFVITGVTALTVLSFLGAVTTLDGFFRRKGST
jgi:hypothetical protein